jgi:hypothetical protein
LPIQSDHNDVWIAATAKVANLMLLSTDGTAFLPLRGTSWVSESAGAMMFPIGDTP